MPTKVELGAILDEYSQIPDSIKRLIEKEHTLWHVAGRYAGEPQIIGGIQDIVNVLETTGKLSWEARELEQAITELSAGQPWGEIVSQILNEMTRVREPKDRVIIHSCHNPNEILDHTLVE